MGLHVGRSPPVSREENSPELGRGPHFLGAGQSPPLVCGLRSPSRCRTPSRAARSADCSQGGPTPLPPSHRHHLPQEAHAWKTYREPKREPSAAPEPTFLKTLATSPNNNPSTGAPSRTPASQRPSGPVVHGLRGPAHTGRHASEGHSTARVDRRSRAAEPSVDAPHHEGGPWGPRLFKASIKKVLIMIRGHSP